METMEVYIEKLNILNEQAKSFNGSKYEDKSKINIKDRYILIYKMSDFPFVYEMAEYLREKTGDEAHLKLASLEKEITEFYERFRKCEPDTSEVI